MVDTNEACKPFQRWILLVGLGSLVWAWLKGLFDYDLGFGEQQLNPNSHVITSSSQSPRDFSKQTPLNSTTSIYAKKITKVEDKNLVFG